MEYTQRIQTLCTDQPFYCLKTGSRCRGSVFACPALRHGFHSTVHSETFYIKSLHTFRVTIYLLSLHDPHCGSSSSISKVSLNQLAVKQLLDKKWPINMIASPKSFPPEQVAKYPTVLCWYLSDFLGVLIFFFFKSHMVRMFGNVRKDLFFLSLTAKHDRPRACCRLGTRSFFVIVRWQRVDKMKVRNSYK